MSELVPPSAHLTVVPVALAIWPGTGYRFAY
jgi:hypothetical protein